MLDSGFHCDLRFVSAAVLLPTQLNHLELHINDLPKALHRLRVQLIEKELFPSMPRVAAVDELIFDKALDRCPCLVYPVFKRRPDGGTEDVDPVKDTFPIGTHPDLGEEAL